MKEAYIVNTVVNTLIARGFQVATEVANFYRSADVAVIDDDNKIWIVECKISDIKKAIEQLKTHKLSADRVYIATPYKKTRQSTLDRINEEDIGLIYIMQDGEMEVELEISGRNSPWVPGREKLKSRILNSQIL